MSLKDQSYVIVVGKYKGMDYVESYNFGSIDFSDLVARLEDMRKHGAIDRVDAPPQFRVNIKKAWQV